MIELELIYNEHFESFYTLLSKKYKISKSKLKTMWADRENNTFPPKVKRGTVLELLARLKITEKIVKVNNYYVHPTSGFLFNPVTRKAIGRVVKTENGEICETRDLTEEDILDCQQWKFDHDIPMNLDKKDKLEAEIEVLDSDDE